MTLQKIKKYMLIIAGVLTLCLGVVGIFIPVLPTTPFLLLSAMCFLRSSAKLYNWLINHKVFGEYIYNYLNYRAVKKSAKISALIFLWTSILISVLLIDNLHVKILLLIIAACVTIHISKLKTLNISNTEAAKSPLNIK
mgnify:CR=1 FL=1|jgi:hypothetical protein